MERHLHEIVVATINAGSQALFKGWGASFVVFPSSEFAFEVFKIGQIFLHFGINEVLGEWENIGLHDDYKRAKRSQKHPIFPVQAGNFTRKRDFLHDSRGTYFKNKDMSSEISAGQELSIIAQCNTGDSVFVACKMHGGLRGERTELAGLGQFGEQLLSSHVETFFL